MEDQKSDPERTESNRVVRKKKYQKREEQVVVKRNRRRKTGNQESWTEKENDCAISIELWTGSSFALTIQCKYPHAKIVVAQSKRIKSDGERLGSTILPSQRWKGGV